MEDVVAQLPFTVTRPLRSVPLQLMVKDCYIIRSGQHAVDYTGLRVWPGAHLLTRFLLQAGKGHSALQRMLPK